jgi:uncharacterized RDD family membrane protein YckC
MTYDWLLLGGTLFVLTLTLIVVRGGHAIAPGTRWFELLLLAASFLFFAWFWTHGGQTLGMRAWKIRVERLDGGPLRWRDAAARFASAATLLFPPGLGLLWALVDSDRRCWHDRLSCTRVVLRAC